MFSTVALIPIDNPELAISTIVTPVFTVDDFTVVDPLTVVIFVGIVGVGCKLMAIGMAVVLIVVVTVVVVVVSLFFCQNFHPASLFSER